MNELFYAGHKVLINSGYFVIYFPEHHLAVDNGMVYVHRLAAEKKLGRQLSSEEIVHHVDYNRLNNAPENLMVFKTNRDHLLFHKGYECELQGDVFVAKENTKPISRTLKECPSCGKLINNRSSLCRECFNKTSEWGKVTPSELKYLSERYPYTAIGKMFGVSDKAVKKACVKNGINKQCYPESPNREELLLLLNNKTANEVAKHYGVARETVLRWAEKYDIPVIPRTAVVCVETNVSYDSHRAAGRDMYPTLNPRVASRGITRVVNTENDYRGYHWKGISEKP